MANSKLRCRSCKLYYYRDTFFAKGYHSQECLSAYRAREVARRPSQARKARKQGNEYSAEFEGMRALVHARSKDYCEARIPGVCKAKSFHIHHRQLRSQGGENSLSNLIDLCPPCHAWVHANPKWSKAVGLLVSSWDDPAEITVDLSRYKEGEVTLTTA